MTHPTEHLTKRSKESREQGVHPAEEGTSTGLQASVQPFGDIVVAEPDEIARKSIAGRLIEEGFEVVEASHESFLVRMIEKKHPSLLIFNVEFDQGAELRILSKIKIYAPGLPVLLLTNGCRADRIAHALARGADDFVSGSVDLEELVARVKRIVGREAPEAHFMTVPPVAGKARSGLRSIIGRSKAMRDLRALLKQVSAGNATTIVLRGKSGTGKDHCARAIHAESTRAEKPFLNITCTALQDTLLESELFGHEKGAFTDAKTLKQGLFELAHGGTLYLDEIGEMSPLLQGKVLRVIEDKAFRRVGGTKDIHVNVRVVAATNQNLEELVRKRKFREDLYYRLNVMTIDLPVLRAHREDVPDLTRHFLRRFSEESGRAATEISSEAIRFLERHDWPGNVRELRNVLERAVLLAQGNELGIFELRSNGLAPNERLPEWNDSEDLSLSAAEMRHIKQVLQKTGGNKRKAAMLLRISPTTLRSKVAE